jgi:hypothetical protein
METLEQTVLERKWRRWLNDRPVFPDARIRHVIGILKLVAHVYDPEEGDQVGPAAMKPDYPASVVTRKEAAVAALLAGHATSGLLEADAKLVVEAVWAGVPKPASTASNAAPAPPAAPMPQAPAQAATPLTQRVAVAQAPTDSATTHLRVVLRSVQSQPAAA